METVGQTYGPTSSQISSVFIKIYRSRPLDGGFAMSVLINAQAISVSDLSVSRPKLYRYSKTLNW